MKEQEFIKKSEGLQIIDTTNISSQDLEGNTIFVKKNARENFEYFSRFSRKKNIHQMFLIPIKIPIIF